VFLLGNNEIFSMKMKRLLLGLGKKENESDRHDSFEPAQVLKRGISLVLQAKEESARFGQTGLAKNHEAPAHDEDIAIPETLEVVESVEIRTADSLIPFMDEKDPEIRLAAIAGLGEIGDPRAIEVLKEALKASGWEERRVIAASLSQLGWEHEKNENGLLYCLAVGDWQACASIGKFVVPQLIEALRSSGDKEVCVTSALALGVIGDYRITEPLIRALQDPNAEVRQAAALSLGRAKRRKAAEPLFEALVDVDNTVAQAARTALIEIGEAGLEPLTAALKDGDEERRMRAARLLSLMGDTKELQGSLQRFLLYALKDGDKWSRIRMASALGEIRKEWAVKPLIEALYYYGVRASAREALMMIGETAILPLNSALHHRYIVVRKTAAEILGQIGDERSMKPLQGALNDKDWNVREAAQEALELLRSKGVSEEGIA
jgi:HEAT repeat protein